MIATEQIFSDGDLTKHFYYLKNLIVIVVCYNFPKIMVGCQKKDITIQVYYKFECNYYCNITVSHDLQDLHSC